MLTQAAIPSAISPPDYHEPVCWFGDHSPRFGMVLFASVAYTAGDASTARQYGQSHTLLQTCAIEDLLYHEACARGVGLEHPNLWDKVAHDLFAVCVPVLLICNFVVLSDSVHPSITIHSAWLVTCCSKRTWPGLECPAPVVIPIRTSCLADDVCLRSLQILSSEFCACSIHGCVAKAKRLQITEDRHEASHM